jgi:hypothetical protein
VLLACIADSQQLAAPAVRRPARKGFAMSADEALLKRSRELDGRANWLAKHANLVEHERLRLHEEWQRIEDGLQAALKQVAALKVKLANNEMVPDNPLDEIKRALEPAAEWQKQSDDLDERYRWLLKEGAKLLENVEAWRKDLEAHKSLKAGSSPSESAKPPAAESESSEGRESFSVT